MHPLLSAVGLSPLALAPAPILGQYSPPPPQQQPPMQAGGLSPPPSTSSSPESMETERQLSEAESEDSGRGLEFFFINAEFGVEHLGLQAFKANDLVDAEVVETSQTGLTYGAGLGVRLLFLTIGARFRLSDFSAWQVWTLNGEVGYRIPLGDLEPYFYLGGGFASLGAFEASDVGGGARADDVDVSGFDIRAGGGLDYYLTPVFSIGASVSGELLALSRSRLSGQAAPSAGVYTADGSSLGFGFTGTAVLGLHF
jgi:hypothetical protein